MGEKRAEFRRLEPSPGPRDEWRGQEARSATRGRTLSAWYCARALGDRGMCDRWFCGIQLERAEDPSIVVLPGVPSVLAEREEAGMELDRLAALGKIRWDSEGSRPPDLRACSSHMIAKADKVRVVRDWPNVLFPLNRRLRGNGRFPQFA